MPMLRDHNVTLRLGEVLAKHLAAANLLGRSQIAQAVHRKTGKLIPIATSSRFHSHLGGRRSLRFQESDDAEDAAALGAPDLLAGFSTSLPAPGAANYLRELTPVTRETFDGLTAQYRKDAFTIAGTTDVRLIQKVRDELADVLQRGGTKADFDAAVKKLTSDAGVAEINAFALDTIFQTNLQKAYSLGRYEQMTDPDVADALPFWQYMTVGDDRVRPEHRVLDGFTARAVDRVWNKIYPPNGFNCRCIVIPLLASEAPKGAEEDGMARLPLLAMTSVPQPGFSKVFAVAA